MLHRNSDTPTALKQPHPETHQQHLASGFGTNTSSWRSSSLSCASDQNVKMGRLSRSLGGTKADTEVLGSDPQTGPSPFRKTLGHQPVLEEQKLVSFCLSSQSFAFWFMSL